MSEDRLRADSATCGCQFCIGQWKYRAMFDEQDDWLLSEVDSLLEHLEHDTVHPCLRCAITNCDTVPGQHPGPTNRGDRVSSQHLSFLVSVRICQASNPTAGNFSRGDQLRLSADPHAAAPVTAPLRLAAHRLPTSPCSACAGWPS